MPKSFHQKLSDRVAKTTKNRLKDHKLTVLKEDGLYRHYRCNQPGSYINGFDIITWPGSLTYTGGMGTYVFQRIPDMISFVERSCMSFGYMEEKCVAADRIDGIKQFYPELIEEEFQQLKLNHDKEDYNYIRLKDKIEAVREEFSNYENPDDALRVGIENELWDSADAPDFKDYNFHFLFCLHALQWFCNELNKFKTSETIS